MQNDSDGKDDDDEYNDAVDDDGSMDYDDIDLENNNDIGVREGTEVKFLCISNANPLEVTYKWIINNVVVVGDYTTEMVIYNLIYFPYIFIVCDRTKSTAIIV